MSDIIMDNVFVQHNVTGLLEPEILISPGVHVAGKKPDFLVYAICGDESILCRYRAKWLDRSS
jgi:hypothetical protein